jgi:hypothetical protein
MRVRLPGLLVMPLQIITPGTAEATASLIMYGPLFSDVSLALFSSTTVVFGPLLLLLVVCLPQWNRAKLVTLPQRRGAVSDGKRRALGGGGGNNDSDDDDDGSNHAASSCWRTHVVAPLQRAYAWLLVPGCDWIDKDVPAPTEPRAHDQLRGGEHERGPWTTKFGVVFEDFDRPMFAVMDLGVSVVLGFCAGVSIGAMTRPACLMWLATATLAAAMHLIYLLRRRPCLSRLQQFYQTFSSCVTLVTVVFATLMFLGQVLNFDVVASWLMDVQSIVSLITALLQLISLVALVFQIYDAWKTGRDRHNRNAQRQTFSLEEVLLRDPELNGEDMIDLTDFLNGDGVVAAAADEDDGADPDIDLSELLRENDAIEIDAELFDAPPEPAAVPITLDYALEEEDGGGVNVNVNVDDDLDDGSAELDEDGRPIGKAHKANEELHQQLTSMLRQRGASRVHKK